MRRLFFTLAAIVLTIAAPSIVRSDDFESQINAEVERGRDALNQLEEQLREADQSYERKKEILVPLLQPHLAKLPPSEWVNAYLDAYNKLPASAVQPASPKKMPIFVDTSTDSRLARQLAFQIKEGLRRSAGMELVFRADDALVRLIIVALDVEEGISTAYSAVWTMRDVNRGVWLFVDSEVGHCGWTRVNNCAESIVAVTDERAYAIVQGLQKSLKLE